MLRCACLWKFFSRRHSYLFVMFSCSQDYSAVCMIVKTCKQAKPNMSCKVATLLPRPPLDRPPRRPYHIIHKCHQKVSKCKYLSRGHFLTPTTHSCWPTRTCSKWSQSIAFSKTFGAFIRGIWSCFERHSCEICKGGGGIGVLSPEKI